MRTAAFASEAQKSSPCGTARELRAMHAMLSDGKADKAELVQRAVALSKREKQLAGQLESAEAERDDAVMRLNRYRLNRPLLAASFKDWRQDMHADGAERECEVEGD